jgi:bifunctional DNase/RNase
MSGGLLFDALSFTSGELDPYRVVEAREIQRLILQAVEALPPKNRAATLLFYYEQLSVREIALLLGISVTAVKGRLNKSRQQLRRQLTLHNVPDQEVFRVRGETVMTEKVKVTVADVVQQESGNFSVVLVDETNRRMLPIWIGPTEGHAIALRLLELTTPRPMTYAFLANTLTRLNVVLEEVRIEALREITYYAIAKLRLDSAIYEVDARPSDAIALALQMQSPIYVAAGILEQKGIAIPEEYDLVAQRKGLQKVSEILEANMQENERKLQEAKEMAAKSGEQERAEVSQKLLEFLFTAAT